MGTKLSDIKDPKQRAMIAAADAAQSRKPGSLVNISIKELATQFNALPDKDPLNQTEREFHEFLKNCSYDRVQPHAVRLELADKCRYTPDFYCVRKVFQESPIIHIYEVKGGHLWEDGWVKLKIAARMYPEFMFFFAQKKSGKWKMKEMPR